MARKISRLRPELADQIRDGKMSITPLDATAENNNRTVIISQFRAAARTPVQAEMRVMHPAKSRVSGDVWDGARPSYAAS